METTTDQQEGDMQEAENMALGPHLELEIPSPTTPQLTIMNARNPTSSIFLSREEERVRCAIALSHRCASCYPPESD